MLEASGSKYHTYFDGILEPGASNIGYLVLLGMICELGIVLEVLNRYVVFGVLGRLGC